MMMTITEDGDDDCDEDDEKLQVSLPWGRAGCLAVVIHCPLDAHNQLQPFVQHTHTACVLEQSKTGCAIHTSCVPNPHLYLSAHHLHYTAAGDLSPMLSRNQHIEYTFLPNHYWMRIIGASISEYIL